MIDHLSNFIGIFIIFFSVLAILYSIGYMKNEKGLFGYYSCLILTMLVSLGAVFANNLLVFIIFWGFIGFLLYILIGYGKNPKTPETAKKMFIIVGGTDALMVLGLALIWKISGTLEIDKIHISLDSKPAFWAYVLLVCGAFAKAGALPFHTWIPDTAENAPVSVTGFLPAAVDKLLGIYFLFRLSTDLFIMNAEASLLLMAVGSITIIAAVMMALVQHDFKRLLGYHAVSQVGYMVLGIGTGNAVGLAGGLFHMLNHAIYKSCLFFCSGSVEKQTNTTNLDNLGGLSKLMPVTFTCFIIASMSISGIPPFNGFSSKWLVYQGIIETASKGGFLWIIWLVAAMFGSALTVASFMKLIHAVFLGQPSIEVKQKAVKEVEISMKLPVIILASLCVIFGVFAYQLPLKYFIFPSITNSVKIIGVWDSEITTVLIFVGLILGIIIYLAGIMPSKRKVEVFFGGELLKDHPDMRMSGTEFYNTVSDIKLLKNIYKMADLKLFDIYDVLKWIITFFGLIFSFLHNGIVNRYFAWIITGAIIIICMAGMK